MISITKPEFEKNKTHYNKLTYVMTDNNGTEHYTAVCQCPRCFGQKVIISRIENGKVITVTPDEGVCWKCLGVGTFVEKIKVYTPEHAAKLEAQRKKAEAKRREEIERKQAETIAHAEQVNRELGYKPIDFTFAEWFDHHPERYTYYRIVKETTRAILIHLIHEMTEYDGAANGYWVPKSAIIFKGGK